MDERWKAYFEKPEGRFAGWMTDKGMDFLENNAPFAKALIKQGIAPKTSESFSALSVMDTESAMYFTD
jgi:hypothetical protein